MARSFEAKIARGFGAFVIVAIGCNALSMIPFFVRYDVYRLGSLAQALAMGLIPAAALGIWATRREGLPAAMAFFAWSLDFVLFLQVRVEELFLAAAARRNPDPDYPRAFGWLIPLAWCVAVAAMAIASLPKREFAEKEDAAP